MNIKDLEYYQKLVATHSYTKTAEFFNLSQPSISAAVKRLSKEFRTLRKRREEDSLRPQQWNLESIWNDEKWGSWGKLSTVAWGVSPIVGKVYLAKILTELDQENLNHNIEITEAGSNDLSAKLKMVKSILRCSIRWARSTITTIKANYCELIRLSWSSASSITTQVNICTCTWVTS